jgi:hypothetical protein
VLIGTGLAGLKNYLSNSLSALLSNLKVFPDEDGEDFEQTRFSEGRLVRDSQQSDHATGGLVSPNQETGFSVAIKPDALEVNQSLVEIRDEYSDTITFASRAKAEAFAAQVSATGGDLRIQAAAPNDPAAVDAYLLADHQPSVAEPASVGGDTWTFDVGANLYGALGEAVVTGGPTSPALEYFVEQDLADRAFEHGLRVRIADGEFVSFSEGESDGGRWMPDCRIEARDGWRDRLIETYWCEIKTGDASFERTQIEAMRQLAREERVLKVRVLIDDLPKRYAARIHEVDPDG